MAETYLLDINILIYYFNDSLPTSNLDFDSIFRESFNISVITKIEFLGWNQFNEQQFQIAEKVIHAAKILHLNEDIATHTIKLRRQSNIKIPDAIIAATGVVHHLTLITRNEKDFQKIRNLNILNPFAKG